MIINKEPISMIEVMEYAKKNEESEADIKGFIRKFKKADVKKAEELKKELQNLDLIKMKTDHIIKIIDLMPEEKEELNKIFTDVGLNEDETKKILETIKKFK